MPAAKKHANIEDFQLSLALQKQPFVIFMRSYSKKFAQLSGNYLCQSPLFNKVAACNFIEKEILTHAYKIFKNSFLPGVNFDFISHIIMSYLFW